MGEGELRGRWRLVAVVAVLTVAGAACGDDPDPLAVGEDPPAVPVDEAGLPPFCDDVAALGPVAEGDLSGMENVDEILLGVLQTYANAHPDTFGGLWIDRTAGSVVLAFTDDLAVHRAAIAELRPSPDDDAVVQPPPEITATTTVSESGTTVDVVRVQRTEAELMALADEHSGLMGGDLGVFGMGVSTDINRVSVMLEVADPATRAALAEIVPVDAVCVEGPVAAPEPIDPDQVDLLSAEDDPMVSCGLGTFRLSALDTPADFEQSDDPLAEALRAELPAMAPELGAVVEAGWRLLHRDDTSALLGAGDPPSTFVTMTFEGDRWRLGMGQASQPCEPRRAAPDGLEEVRWWLDPAHSAPGPDDTEVHVLVSGTACSGGEPVDERLIGPQVELTDDEVVIAFAAVPLPNGMYTCQGNPPTPVVVALDEPVGDRTVVDALSLPPRPPVGNIEP